MFRTESGFLRGWPLRRNAAIMRLPAPRWLPGIDGMNELRLNAAYYRPEHLDFRETVRRFVAREISPHVNDWDEAESFPRDLYRKAADVGLLGLGFPEEFGGIAGTSAGIAQILLFIFIVLFVVAMIARALRGEPPV